jgi:hypothetical protein
MSYCAGEPPLTRDAGDPLPTDLDLLGVEMLYPRASGYKLKCASGCFVTGNGVVVRANGAITNEWMARGALAVPMSLTGTPGGTSIPATSIASGSSTVTYNFWDPRGVARAGSGTAVKSDAHHAAIVASLRTL